MTRKFQSKSTRWNRQHGRKKVHRWRVTALWHVFKLNRLGAGFQGQSKKWQIYPCWWGQGYRDGESAEKHWHVGRPGRHTADVPVTERRKRG